MSCRRRHSGVAVLGYDVWPAIPVDSNGHSAARSPGTAPFLGRPPMNADFVPVARSSCLGNTSRRDSCGGTLVCCAPGASRIEMKNDACCLTPPKGIKVCAGSALVPRFHGKTLSPSQGRLDVRRDRVGFWNEFVLRELSNRPLGSSEIRPQHRLCWGFFLGAQNGKG
jgi:hypothetical protein